MSFGDRGLLPVISHSTHTNSRTPGAGQAFRPCLTCSPHSSWSSELGTWGAAPAHASLFFSHHFSLKEEKASVSRMPCLLQGNTSIAGTHWPYGLSPKPPQRVSAKERSAQSKTHLAFTLSLLWFGARLGFHICKPKEEDPWFRRSFPALTFHVKVKGWVGNTRQESLRFSAL